MTVEDHLLMLDVLFGLHVALAPDGEHLVLRGPPDAVDVASPIVLSRKHEFVAHLRAQATQRFV